MLYPLKLEAPLKDYIWGGTRLKSEFGKKTLTEKVAESWELSCHEAGLSRIKNGPEKGKPLKDYIKEHGKGSIGDKAPSAELPLLVKLIDAHDNLSLQVHPDDDYARSVENSRGKTEMWYIVDAEPGAELIYGLKEKMSREEFAAALEKGNILHFCRSIPVKKGDVFFIPAGTLHAIGKGLLIAEIQQSCDLTYRVYDYNRLGNDGKPRKLHIGKAISVTTLAPLPLAAQPQKISIFADYECRLLQKCPYFTVFSFGLFGNCDLNAGLDSFHSLLCLKGQLALTAKGESMLIEKGESVFLPAGLGAYRLNGTGEFLLTTL